MWPFSLTFFRFSTSGSRKVIQSSYIFKKRQQTHGCYIINWTGPDHCRPGPILTYRALHCQGPAYIPDLLQPDITSRSLRSSFFESIFELMTPVVKRSVDFRSSKWPFTHLLSIVSVFCSCLCFIVCLFILRLFSSFKSVIFHISLLKIY